MKQAATSTYKQLLVFVLVSACICLYVFLENQIQAETSRYKQIQAGGKGANTCCTKYKQIQAETSTRIFEIFCRTKYKQYQADTSTVGMQD